MDPDNRAEPGQQAERPLPCRYAEDQRVTLAAAPAQGGGAGSAAAAVTCRG